MRSKLAVACIGAMALLSLAHAQTPDAPAPRTGALDNALAQVNQLIVLGGPVIPILMAVSIFGLAVVLIKMAQFAVVRIGEHRFVDVVARHLRAGEFDAADDVLRRSKGPVAAVMRAAVAGRGRKGDDQIVREEVDRIAQAQIDSLERGLPLIALVASISPLLGLLGTVTGLIEAFQALAAAGDRVDPGILASGIWEALLTTVMGLAIGIPAATIHLLMQGVADTAAKRMEDAATQVFTVDLYRRDEAVAA